MANKYEYRPPLGFDIRVKPDRDSDRESKNATRTCEWEGCERPAPHRAPRSPNREDDFLWFCQSHAQQYNRSWNFFADMSTEEVKEYQEATLTGNRPTWAMGTNAKTQDGWTPSQPGFKPGRSRPHGRGEQMKSRDAYGFIREGAAAEGSTAQRRQIPKLQRQALETLDLPETCSLNDIKQRYKELVKRFHPDANGGNRGAEDRLRQVINAYRTLRAANFR